MGAGNVDATTTLDVRLELLILKETWLTSRYVLLANYKSKVLWRKHPYLNLSPLRFSKKEENRKGHCCATENVIMKIQW